LTGIPERRLYADAKGTLTAKCVHQGTRSQLVTLEADLYCVSCRDRTLREEPKILCRCGHTVAARHAVSSNLGTLCRPCYDSESKAAAEHARKREEDLNKRHKYRGHWCWACNATEYLERCGSNIYGCPQHRR